MQAYDVRNHPITVTAADGTPYTITQNTGSNVNARSRAVGLGVGGYQLFADDANSDYNALQATVTHRYANGLQLEAAYTWSKTIDETSTGNTAFNTAVNDQTSLADSRGLSDFDREHRFTVAHAKAPVSALGVLEVNARGPGQLRSVPVLMTAGSGVNRLVVERVEFSGTHSGSASMVAR